MKGQVKREKGRREEPRPQRRVTEADLARIRRLGQDPKWFDDIV